MTLSHPAMSRWIDARPDLRLTWGQWCSGNPTVRALAREAAFGPSAKLVEIGPGYGRTIATMLECDEPFAQYDGIDVAGANVVELQKRFGQPERVRFHLGTIDDVPVARGATCVFSFLTFKHLYPTFVATMRAAHDLLAPGGLLLFDLLLGGPFWKWEVLPDGRSNFLRRYGRAEAEALMGKVPWDTITWGRICHGPGRIRDLVAARKPCTNASS